MVRIRAFRRSDSEQLLDAMHIFKSEHKRGTRKHGKVSPLLWYRDYDGHLRDEVRKYTRLNPKKAIIFVAEDKGRLVGYAYGQIVHRPWLVFDKMGIIEDWYVDESYRNRRIGRGLFDALVGWFRERGCNCLELDVYPGNEDAMRIYRRYGFNHKITVLAKRLQP